MSTATIENQPPAANADSKSARKKKSKVEAEAPQPTAVPAPQSQEASDPADSNGAYEHPHLKELQKQIRNINKRLVGLQKTDTVISQNPGVTLDDLVKQKKINLDQKAAAEKKPGLQAQVQQFEEQVKVFRAVNDDYQVQLTKQKEDLTSQHQKELEKAREEANTSATSTSASELRKKLLIFSQFLRTAAAKRNVEDHSDPAENDAFEGALLLAYGGDEKAVDTAVAIIEGSEEQVPSIEGVPLEVKYSQIRQASIENTPFQSEEAWVDSVAEANAATGETQAAQEASADAVPTGSDPTIAHAGLNELETPANAQTNGTAAVEHDSSAVQASAGDEGGNQAGDRWDTGAGAQAEGLEDESYEIVPRPNDEVDVPAPAPAAGRIVDSLLKDEKTSWADEANAASSGATAGNQAGEAWDTKAAGETQGNDASAVPAFAALDGAAASTPTDDGFQEVRGGRGGRGDAFRGRGGRGRGGPRGDFRGRGRGDFRGGRGGAEYRGRGGPRGEFRGRGRGSEARGGAPVTGQ
ncbi:hypothetical protein LTR62_001717 [Meristemomyces frigidus]|uniref:YAG7-like dimerisation domain-containing protein n=1 Tax=Meristemomyces frigidus TaxID=1508187 RepID=A0AAN7TAR6_9PEZI|nr:hypothetical protein LTR62_001717 [Meristemomyces frigidus]